MKRNMIAAALYALLLLSACTAQDGCRDFTDGYTDTMEEAR